MPLFVKVMFYVMIFECVVKTLYLGFGDYPRRATRGADALDLLIAVPLIMWGWYLLYGV